MKGDLYIVNRMDRPSEDHIAEEHEDGLLYYIHPRLRSEWAGRGMSKADATLVSDFGVVVDREGNTLRGAATNPSVAKYSDGSIRPWQGALIFAFATADPEVKPAAPTPVPAKPDCYECAFRGGVPGSCHSSCRKWTAQVSANEHGIKMGWFAWPFDFDPVWLVSCDSFQPKEGA